jgi:RNA recognition motif-containing protein
VDHFEDFYEEVFMELANYGEIEDIIVADNIGDHMMGNVYVKFASEEQAQKALNALNGRFYAGKIIKAEYSPVTDFREAKCRQYKEGQCDSKLIRVLCGFKLKSCRRRLLQLHAPKACQQRPQEERLQGHVRRASRL